MNFPAFVLKFSFGVWTFFAKIIVFIFYPFIRKFSKWRLARYGMNINGSGPTDIQVLNEKKFYTRLGVDWSLGFGEAYLEESWKTQDLTGALAALFRDGILGMSMHPLTFLHGYLNLQKGGSDSDIVAEHYNFGNDWYEALLGPSMQYTCAYWKTATNLQDAQFDKMELIAQKLKLKPGMRILDIGCGWGTLALHLAKHHGVSVVCITISKEQGIYVKEKTKGYPIDIRVMHYRDLKDIATFDRVTTIGCLEHIGVLNYKTYFKIVRQCLKDDGLALIQVIMRNADKLKYGNEPFVHKYIFPNGWSPSQLEMTKSVQGILTIEDWALHGQYYEKTLEAWKQNFYNAWPNFREKYEERVFRLWDYYLSQGIALYQERVLTLSQIVLSKNGIPGGYVCVR